MLDLVEKGEDLILVAHDPAVDIPSRMLGLEVAA